MAYQYQDPFTYASSARPVQAAPSFQNLMDEVRTQTAQTIARQQEATSAPTPGLADARNYGGGNGGGDGSSQSSSGSPNSSSLNSSNSTVTGNYGGLGKAIGGVFGGPIGGLVGGVIGSNVESRSYNGYGGLDGTTTEATGPGTIGSRDSYGSNESSSGPGPGPGASTDASSASAVNGSDSMSDGYGGNGAGGFGGSGSDGNGSADNGSAASASSDGSDGAGWAKGGTITAGGMVGLKDIKHFTAGGKIGLADIRHFTSGGPNRMGVDDGLAATEVGEFILTAQRTKQIGAAALKALCEGRATIVLKGTK